MKTIEYTKTMDRSKWGKGPWNDEPQDKIQWLDEASNLPCIAKRGPLGAWCGYVGVPAGHSFYRMDYNDVDIDQPHGGLTYADFCMADVDEEHAICHVVEPGEPDDVWWLGFDCAHANDVIPGLDHHLQLYDIGRVYRTLDYVREECRQFAARLVA